MVCPSFVLGGDANTGSAGYVCLEVELMDGESDFYAAMLDAFAFAAFLGLPSFFAVVCPGAATLFLDGESDFFAAMLAAIVFAALMGWPSCIVADCPAVLCYAALSEVLCRFWVPAAMLVWAALSDGYGWYACCVAYSLEFCLGLR